MEQMKAILSRRTAAAPDETMPPWMALRQRRMRLGGVDGQMAVHSGPSKRTFEAMQPDWMLRLTSGFLQNSSCTLPDTPAPPARAQDGRKAPNGIRLLSLSGG